METVEVINRKGCSYSEKPNSSDLISRRKTFEYFVTLWECIGTIMDRDEWEDVCMTTANEIPSAQSDYQEVLGWLLAYHTMSFDLHGRHLPHEVISWLINDFTKEFIAKRGQNG